MTDGTPCGNTLRLFVHNWDKWQSYRRDRNQPPWIKVHRELMRNWEWIELSDAERGQVVSIWLLAADKDGEVPPSPRLIQKLCHLDAEPDIKRLIDMGFLEWRQDGVNTTPSRRQHDAPEAEAKAETEAETEAEARADADAELPPTDFGNLIAKLAALEFSHDAVHKPAVIAKVRRWADIGVTPDDLSVVVGMLRSRPKTQSFGPAYIDQPLCEYMEAKRNGNAERWRTGKQGAGQSQAERFHEFNKAVAAGNVDL